ncbi:hypothetical protein JCM11641_006366 [Rhodosporidiobolus odoratus]
MLPPLTSSGKVALASSLRYLQVPAETLDAIFEHVYRSSTSKKLCPGPICKALLPFQRRQYTSLRLPFPENYWHLSQLLSSVDNLATFQCRASPDFPALLAPLRNPTCLRELVITTAVSGWNTYVRITNSKTPLVLEQLDLHVVFGEAGYTVDDAKPTWVKGSCAFPDWSPDLTEEDYKEIVIVGEEKGIKVEGHAVEAIGMLEACWEMRRVEIVEGELGSAKRWEFMERQEREYQRDMGYCDEEDQEYWDQF